VFSLNSLLFPKGGIKTKENKKGELFHKEKTLKATL
jgi:hypothetical protein